MTMNSTKIVNSVNSRFVKLCLKILYILPILSYNINLRLRINSTQLQLSSSIELRTSEIIDFIFCRKNFIQQLEGTTTFYYNHCILVRESTLT